MEGSFPLDFEMEEKKSMDRGKYDFFTSTSPNLSLPYIKREKQELYRTLGTSLSLMSVSQRNLCSWFFFPEKQLPFDNEEGQNKAINQ